MLSRPWGDYAFSLAGGPRKHVASDRRHAFAAHQREKLASLSRAAKAWHTTLATLFQQPGNLLGRLELVTRSFFL